MAGLRQTDATMMTDEQRHPDFVFQIPDPSTYRRLLNAKRFRRLAKARSLSRRYDIAKMAQFNCQSRAGAHSRRPGQVDLRHVAGKRFIVMTLFRR